MYMPEVAKHLSQSKIYQLLRTVGSPWLKAHVLYANDKIVLLNKPSNLVCQVNNSGNKFKVGHDVSLYSSIFNLLPFQPERNSTFLNSVFEGDYVLLFMAYCF